MWLESLAVGDSDRRSPKPKIFAGLISALEQAT
jgi:hypothetical protein